MRTAAAGPVARSVQFAASVSSYDAPSSIACEKRRSEALASELTCRICGELADAPMLASCCRNASAFGAICFSCMYAFLKLADRPTERVASGNYVRSWSLSCNDNCRFKLFEVTLLHSAHTSLPVLDRLRDAHGASRCFACKETFATTAALRRHLTESCRLVHTKCSQCDYYGTRAQVQVHTRDLHDRIVCPCCDESVPLAHWALHARRHVRRLSRPQTTASGLWSVTAEGAISRLQ